MSRPKELVDTPGKRICPGSFWNLGKEATPPNRNSPSLTRWTAVYEALAADLGSGAAPTPPQSQFDPVQAGIVATQIKRARQHFGSLDPGEIDLEWQSLATTVESDELRVFFQFARKSEGDRLELYRLKTARVKGEDEFASSPEEIAAVVTDPRFPDEMEAYEVRASDGEMIRLEMGIQPAQIVLTDLGRDFRTMMRSDPEQLVPGRHCSTCKVADRCITFPAISPRSESFLPLTKRLPSARRLMISKSRLPEVGYCQRRAAWRVAFHIPSDPDHRRREVSPGLELGNRFHRLMARALTSSDPASFFSGDLEVEALYRQHLSLPCTTGILVKKTEFPLGFTSRFRTPQGSVSVVLYGLADGVGREADGTPMVVDHKTGGSPRTHPYEAELYALGAFLRIGNASTVATHIHQLSTTGSDPFCDREVWKRDQVGELVEKLGSLAETAAGWDQMDATSPPYRVGEWCGTCPFEQRCKAYR